MKQIQSLILQNSLDIDKHRTVVRPDVTTLTVTQF